MCAGRRAAPPGDFLIGPFIPGAASQTRGGRVGWPVSSIRLEGMHSKARFCFRRPFTKATAGVLKMLGLDRIRPRTPIHLAGGALPLSGPGVVPPGVVPGCAPGVSVLGASVRGAGACAPPAPDGGCPVVVWGAPALVSGSGVPHQLQPQPHQTKRAMMIRRTIHQPL